MKTSTSKCLYCLSPEKLGDFAIKITQLNQSNVYLHVDKTYIGRCIVALKEHKNELFELNEDILNEYMKEVSKVAKVLKKVFVADKINYAIFGDKVSHIHFHLVPKKQDMTDFGNSFVLVPNKSTMNEQEITYYKNNILEELFRNTK